MKKPSIADKKAQKALNDPQFQKNWASHMKSFGPILKDAFAEDPASRVALCAALTHITAKKQPQALLKLNSLQKALVTDGDKAAFFFAMGLFCEYAGKFDEMAALYNQANDLHHRFYLPYLKAGKYALDTRDYGTAEKNYRAAIPCFGIAPTDKEKQLLASAHTNLASCLIMMHRPQEADSALEAARKLMPLFPGRSAPEAILHALRGPQGIFAPLQHEGAEAKAMPLPAAGKDLLLTEPKTADVGVCGADAAVIAVVFAVVGEFDQSPDENGIPVMPAPCPVGLFPKKGGKLGGPVPEKSGKLLPCQRCLPLQFIHDIQHQSNRARRPTPFTVMETTLG
jgi:tetratricopeptide (TPR) repeat protein